MKKIIAIVTVLASVSAFAGFAKTFNGKLSGNTTFNCTFTNTTGSDLNVKRVTFNLERRAGKGDSRDITLTQTVNNVVYSGETSTVTLQGANGNFIGQSCQFVTRN
jgi:hypothetical protein